ASRAESSPNPAPGSVTLAISMPSLRIATAPFLRINRQAVLEPSTITVSPALIDHDWKGGDTVLSGVLFGMNRRCAMDCFLIVLTTCVPVRIAHPEWKQEFSRMQHDKAS